MQVRFDGCYISILKKIMRVVVVLGIFLTAQLFADVKKGETMKISVYSNNNKTVFQLNNSEASKELFSQLPLEIEVKNFGDNEKIFYPPQKLSINDTPKANAQNGTLAYYAPWGDVVMFYEDFGSASGLFELGKVISGKEYIQSMSGMIKIIAE